MGIKLDGYSPDYFGLVFLKDHYHPLTPEMRNKTMTIPGMPGEWDFGSEWGSRPFNLPFEIVEYNRIERQRKLRAFVAFLLDANGKPREIQLTFDYEPEKFYAVKLNGKVDPQRLISTTQFAIPFVAHDPFAYADLTYTEEDITTGITYDSGYQYANDPAEIKMSSLYSLSDSVSLSEAYHTGNYYENPSFFLWTNAKQYSGTHNHSFYAVPFAVEIEGSVLSPRITNQTTGKVLYLPTISNQKLTVDTKKFSIKVDGKHYFTDDIEHFMLSSGDNSLLFEGGQPNATVTFKWKYKFV